MNLNQLREGLEQAFYKENHRLVFWYDLEPSITDDDLTLVMKNDKEE